MEKTGEMDLYLYVDGRGRMTMPRALRCRTGMGKKSNGGMSSIQLSGITGEFGDLFSKNGLQVFLGFGLPTD